MKFPRIAVAGQMRNFLFSISFKKKKKAQCFLLSPWMIAPLLPVSKHFGTFMSMCRKKESINYLFRLRTWHSTGKRLGGGGCRPSGGMRIASNIPCPLRCDSCLLRVCVMFRVGELASYWLLSLRWPHPRVVRRCLHTHTHTHTSSNAKRAG